MLKMRRFLATVTTGLVLGAVQVAAEAPAQADTVHGCPYGSFCIYPGLDWNQDQPEYVFSSYGAHNLYNEYGWRYTYNNQYADPVGTSPPYVAYCNGYNGTGGGPFMNSYLGERSFDATPINSIEIIRYDNARTVCGESS